MSDSVSDSPLQRTGTPFPVVGVGASAGGLEALRGMLGTLPVDTGMGFVIVQHLAPDHASSLAEILANSTKMPVCEVADEPAIEPDHVYVIPPGRDMIVAGGKLVLLPQQRHAAHRGIDRFFRSLAEDSAHLAIGVVLSGGLSDGTVGLEEIKAAGGVTFAQDDSAQHDSMPRSAIASGCVDFVLAPEKIAEEIARIVRHSYIAHRAEVEDDEPINHATIVEIVRGATGVDFTHYKASTLRRRITRRMMLHRLETFAEYEEHLRQTPEEIEELYQDILIGVTTFFRDPEAFEAVARDVFPKLIAACPPGEVVRLWIVGCSSGEEAYSLAMVFTECAEAARSAARLQVFATDVNPRCVEKARAGHYPRSIAQEVSPERLRRFFTEESGGYRVRKAIRERCVFSRHNLLGDPPFSRVDFISCRNLLIYLEPVLQQRVLPTFHYALKTDGWLWLGSSESVGATSTLFDAADLRHKIFTRRAAERPASTRARTIAPSSMTAEIASPRQPGQGVLHRDAVRLLLAKYAPPGVVVSSGLEIVQFQGDTSPYLTPASGAASHHLLKMLREGLAGSVREALNRAEKENGPVRAEGLRVRNNGGFRTLDVEVIPIKPTTPGRDGGFVVLFDEAKRPASESERGFWLTRWWKKWRENGAGGSARDEEIRHLTQELAATRESLIAVSEQHEAVTEELRSANEEAQSANEEMQSVNEELETSKEEMEASNEELATLNDELGERNAQLSRLAEELRTSCDYAESIVAQARVPLVVLDAALTVRSANPAFYEHFRVQPAETEGRCIYDLGNRQWDIPALRRLFEEVLPHAQIAKDYEVRHDFESIGPRSMLLNASALPQTAGTEPLITVSIEDITERELEGEARARLAAIVESSDDAIVGKNLDGIITSWNRGAQRIFGYAAEEIVGRSVLTLIPEERHSEEVEILGHIRRGERVDHLETIRRRKDGTLIHVSLTSSPIVDRAGNIIGASKIARDISERKKAEQAQQEASALLATLIDQSPYCIITLDAALRFQQINPPALKIFGHLGPLIGLPFGTAMETMWGSELAAQIMAIFTHTLTSGECYVSPEFYHARADSGDEQAYEWEIQRLRFPDGRFGVVCYFTDVTKLRALAESLRLSEARYRSIIDSSPDCIKVLDVEGNLLSLESGQKLLGITDVTPLLGKSWLDFWKNEEDRSAARAAVTTATAGDEGHFSGFFRTLRGEDKWWDVAITPMAIVPGQPKRLLAVSRDITERHEMEQMLAARAMALTQADRNKNEFLAMLAHELRNPLAPLRTAAEVLRTTGVEPEEREQAQRIIGRQIENMSRMLDDLLDVSRITEGKIEMRRKPVALEAILTAATSLARAGCAARNQELTLSLPSEPVFLDADATRLEQVFGNLLTNACKYSGHGCHIALKAERAGPEVIVRVQDDGIGIDPELLPHVFELFVQASRTLDRQHGGLGIGLTLVQRIVKLHGGSIKAHSEGLDRGAEFVVRLPILAEPPPPPPPVPVPMPEVPRRILIVDDNTDSARSLAMLQNRRGHTAKTAFTGPEALTIAAEFRPEVILLDIGLPGMDGFEVVRQIRAMPELHGAFIIAMSGYGREEDQQEAKQAGFDDYMVKPVDLEELRVWMRERAGKIQ